MVVVGGGVSLSNSAKITDTSAVHLQRSHQAFNVSPLPCKVYRAATAGWRLSLFFFFSLLSPINYPERELGKKKATFYRHSTSMQQGK